MVIVYNISKFYINVKYSQLYKKRSNIFESNKFNIDAIFITQD